MINNTFLFICYLYSVFKVLCDNFRYLVGLSGLEPPTSRLSGVRSNRLSYKPILPFGLSLYQTLLCNLSITGGDMRDRTADPLLAKQVLSQLSYTPISSFLKVLFRTLKIKQRFKSFRNSDLGFLAILHCRFSIERR